MVGDVSDIIDFRTYRHTNVTLDDYLAVVKLHSKLSVVSSVGFEAYERPDVIKSQVRRLCFRQRMRPMMLFMRNAE